MESAPKSPSSLAQVPPCTWVHAAAHIELQHSTQPAFLCSVLKLCPAQVPLCQQALGQGPLTLQLGWYLTNSC